MKFYLVALLAITSYLLNQAIIMPLVMDYKAKSNVQILKERSRILQSTDAWFALSYFEGIEKSLPGVLWLWDFLGFKKQDFFGLVTENALWSEADNAKWTPIFARWGLPTVEIRVHGSVERGSVKHKVKWANFSTTTAAPLELFFTGKSRITSPTNFLIPNSEDRMAHHGFVFVSASFESPVCKKHAASATTARTIDCAMESVEQTAATVTPEPSSSAYVLSLCSSIPRTSQLSESFSSSSSTTTDVFINVSAIERGEATLEDKKGSYRIIAALQETAEDCPHISLVRFASNETTHRRSSLFVRMPEVQYSDESEVHRSSVYRKVIFLEWIFSYIGAGVLTLARLLMRNTAGISRAAVAKSGMSSRILTVEETVRFQTRSGLSHTRLRDIRKDFNASEYPIKFAPESKILKWAADLYIPASHIEGAALAGSKGTVNCLVYHVHSAAEAAARDLDVNFKNKTYKPCAFQCDNDSELPVISFMYMNDWGGKSDKHVLRLLDVKKSNSPTHCTIIGSAETMRADDSMKPSGCWENFDFVLSRIDGLIDFESNLILQLGDRNVLFPRHTKPDIWSWQLVSEAERGAFFAAPYGSGSTVIEKAAFRAGLPAGSATLVVVGSECLGIRSGPASFPFRKAVKVDTTTAPAPVLFSTSLYTSADLLSLTVVIGDQGQAGCSCPLCRGNASKFKEMALDPSVPCELRTAATQAADYSSYLSSAVKINNFNGVSYPSLLPNMNFNKIIPPVLHLILGLVNDQMQYMWKELLVWDGADPAFAKMLSEYTDLVHEAELEAALSISAATNCLSGHAAVAAVIGREDPEVLVPQSDDLSVFQPLVDALEEAAGRKLEHANEAEALPHQPSGHSGRVRAVAAQKAAAIRAEAEELSAAATSLTEALTALAGARSMLDELMDSSEVDAGGSPKGGALTIALKEALQLYGISMQRYWNGTLVGPDVRKLLLIYEQILRAIADEMAKIHGDAEAARFVARYTSIFVHLRTVSHLTRSTLEGRDSYGSFTAHQLSELETACVGFGEAFREAHGRMLTVKGHLVERHIPVYARRYGILGIFGEDGLEALHPLDSRCRLITRTMRNAKQRSLANIKHMDMAKWGRGPEREKRKRRRSAAAAAVAEDSDADADEPREEEAAGAGAAGPVANDAEEEEEHEGDEEPSAELARIAALRSPDPSGDPA